MKIKVVSISTMEFVVFVVAIILVILISFKVAYSKEIDISITPSVAYDHASWGSGDLVSPTGTHQRDWWGFSGSAQVKWTRWKLQPTFEFGFRQEKFNFANWQASPQEANPKQFLARFGVTYDFKYFESYLLAGISFIDYKVKLVEIQPKIVPHGQGTIHIEARLFNLKLGVYKLWTVGPIKVGPEIAVEYYPLRPQVHRCRFMPMNYLVPSLGIRIQY